MTYFTTYILKLSSGTYYTGLTGDLAKRLAQHNAGQSKSTRNNLPAQLVWQFQSPTRQHARRMEVKIKNRGAAKWMALYQSRPPVNLT